MAYALLFSYWASKPVFLKELGLLGAFIVFTKFTVTTICGFRMIGSASKARRNVCLFKRSI